MASTLCSRLKAGSSCQAGALKRLLPIHSSRPYHSHDHGTPPPFQPAASTILSAALLHVPKSGFTTTALSDGARDAGFLVVSLNLFPRGVFDLVNYHLVTQRLALRNDARSLHGIAGIGARVRALALQRLRANQAIIHHWQEALAIMAQPSHVPSALRELFLLSNEMWNQSSDNTIDTSWYTKRASLAAIYSSAEIFMTTDTSDEFSETERFLDRRLEELQSIGHTLGSIDWVGFSAQATMNVLRSKGARL